MTAAAQSKATDFSGSLTIERTTVIVLFLMLFALATRIPLDSDTWWHLRSGQWMVENRQILLVDEFSHTRYAVPRIPAEWITQIMLYGLWAAGEEIGLAMYTSVLATAGMWLLFRTSDGNVYLRAFLMVLGASAAAVFWSARPHMFTFFFCCVTIYLLMLYKRQGLDRLWWLVPLLALWANMHGGFFIGLLLIYGTLAGETLNQGLAIFRSAERARLLPRLPGDARLRRLAVITVLSTLAVCLNPVGPRLLALPFETFTLTPLRLYIQEWNPPNYADPSVLPFMVLLALTVLVLVAQGWRALRQRSAAPGTAPESLDWTEVLLVVGIGYLAVTAARNIATFTVVGVPIISYHLHAWFMRRGWVLRTVQRPTRRMVRLNQVLIAVVLVASVAKVVLVLDRDLVDEAKAELYPIKAVQVLNERQPAGPLFNSYNWGGYLMFFAPEYLVFVDGRTDLFGDLVLRYADIAFARPGWEAALNDLDVNLIFVETGSALARELQDTADWAILYLDERATIAVRRSTE